MVIALDGVYIRDPLFFSPVGAHEPNHRAGKSERCGVGKTTTAVNMGAALAVVRGAGSSWWTSIPQGNASSGLGLVDRNGVPTIYDVLIRGLPVYRAVQKNPNYPNLDLLPANRDLAGAEIELVGVREIERPS